MWSLTMIKSGLIYSYGMGFWGPNGHDGIWHISLAEGLSKGRFEIPVFAGEIIKNYHIGFDLLLTFIHKITFIPVVNLYFQVLPLVFALSIGLFVYLFTLCWTSSKLSSFFATFFVYFGGSFGWLVTIFKTGQLGGESLFWSQQSISTLVNPPFALSLIFIFAGLYFLDKGLKNSNTKYLIIATFLLGLLVQIKIYAGLLILPGLILAGIINLLRRKGSNLFKVGIGALIISILIFAPFNSNSSISITFQPFWFLESMMQLSDRFGWQKFGEAMANYKTGHIWFKYFISYSLAFAIFIIGNFGSRVLSVIWFFKKGFKLNNYQYTDILVVSAILLGIVIPLFFVQSGTPWNTIQFMYYSLVLSGILAGIALGQYLENKSIGIFYNTLTKQIITLLIILITIPTTIGTLWYNYIPARPPAKISRGELQALYFLATQPDGIILTFPFDGYKSKEAESNPPRPLYLYTSTAYVAAISQKTVFLEDEVNLDITGYDWRSRRKVVEEWYKEKNEDKARKFLSDNNIRYIYWIRGKDDSSSQRALLGGTQLGITKIYDNNDATIYKVSAI